ncbi:unnamed protein product [Rhizoctonia solani]|uniref:Uncharacterized protein n=1 Tax=Rhizoctonia solani TaxID=456999 RepID=A0A8H3DZ41_9AGAM|nr:unnamed protein product [Rhizoctonia solani]
MSGNHFLRSMAEPASHEPEKVNSPNEVPEVHFADTVSVVTEVNKISEAPLVDAPLELTTKDDNDGAKSQNEQIRRSASRDREMRDEEGLALKAVPRDPSEDPPIATSDVADGVERLEISTSPASTALGVWSASQLTGLSRGARGRVEAANPGKTGMKAPAKPQFGVPEGEIAYPPRTNQHKNFAEANEESQRRRNESPSTETLTLTQL